MKMVKNIATVCVLASFMFGSVGFHMANNYSNMDGNMSVDTSWGVTYDLNDKASLGWDSALGMMMHFNINNSTTLRLGWTAAVATGVGDDDLDAVSETSFGIGQSWNMWGSTGGVSTSLSTSLDYVMAPGALNDAVDDNATVNGQVENRVNLSVAIGFGF